MKPDSLTKKADLSPAAYISGYLIIGVITTPVMGIGLIVILIGLIHFFLIKISNRLSVTDKAVEFSKGILSKDVTTLSLRKIETIELQQTFWGRMFRYGRLRFHGTGSSNDYSPFIKNPQAFKAEVEYRIETMQTGKLSPPLPLAT